MNKDRMLDELSVLHERFSNGMGWRDGEYEEALDEAISLISQMSSADVVEVVRCKDCIHWLKDNKPSKKPEYRLCEYYRGYKNQDGFCDFGERKKQNRGKANDKQNGN